MCQAGGIDSRSSSPGYANAADMARTRKRRKGRDHPQLASSDRHHLHTAPREQASSCPDAGTEPQTRDNVAPLEDVALGSVSWKNANANLARGTAYGVYLVPSLDRQALVTPAGPRPPLLALTPTDPPGAVGVHSPRRRVVERSGRPVLRRIADDVRLGRARRECSLALARATDARGRDGLPAIRLLGRLARGAVAEYVAAVSRAGSLRFW